MSHADLMLPGEFGAATRLSPKALRLYAEQGGDPAEGQVQRPQPGDEPPARDLVPVVAPVAAHRVDVGRNE